ncbi:Ribonuclease H1 [Globomyces sp. JEL0801]|nr:Ribonuclease H1 [Globomyces sp. JEL0801]
MVSKKFYAVKKGRKVGVFNNWNDCKEQTDGFSGAVYKSFTSFEEASTFATGGISTKKYRKFISKQSKSTPKEISGNSTKKYGQFISNSTPKETSSQGMLKELEKMKLHNGDVNVVEVYTDGSCVGNGKRGAKAGLGVWFGPNDSRNLSEPLNDPNPTNNRAEMKAVIRALEITSEDRKVIIHSDSNYTIQGITKWIHGWKKRDWKLSNGDDVLNKDLWMRLDTLYHSRSGEKYVAGHSGHLGNEMADQLATQAALLDI